MFTSNPLLHAVSAALCLSVILASQGPKPRGPGYAGAYPSDAARGVLKELQGTETDRFDGVFGPGPWTLRRLVPPILYTPGPAEKDVHRLGALTVKGPHVVMESPFCQWQVPCETDGDVTWIHQLATGEGQVPPAEQMSDRLRAALRFFGQFGPVTRGLRVALVPQTDEVVAGSRLRAQLLLYNASGQDVELVVARTTLRLGRATTAFDLAARRGDGKPYVLRPGQSLERDIDLAAQEWVAAAAEVVDEDEVVDEVVDEVGGQLYQELLTAGAMCSLNVEIELAPDPRGRAGTVRSEVASVKVVAAAAQGGQATVDRQRD